jgi:CBS domain-containing protein
MDQVRALMAIKGEECVVNAKEVMTSIVVTVPPTATLVDAIRLMLDQRVSGLPVVDGTGKLVGVITEGDLLRRPELGTEKPRLGWLLRFLRSSGQEAGEYARRHSRTVEEVMTREVVTVAEGTPAEDIVELMEARRIKRVLVISDGRLVGLVSRADLLRELAKILEQATPPAQSDAAMREKILLELRQQGWSRNDRVSALVTGGEVYLKGTIDDERKRAAIRVIAENVPGVRQVHDQLDCLDPFTASPGV